ncbi:glycosyltransferase, partial [Patescibacteria group bacterium]|nr:glycosyltransferase [Patescibacteria group bacterium]
MDVLVILYLIFTFLGIYYLALFGSIFIQNRKHMFEWFEPERIYGLSIVIPCYNGADFIEKTIENLVKSDYKGLKKIIVVDHCSTDNTYEVIKKCAKKYPNVIALRKSENLTGLSAEAKNYGAKFVKTELIGFTDDDSLPLEDAISKMVGFFNDEKVGAVTSRVLVNNRSKFLARLQSIEYKIIAFTRKLFGFVESIYVTNGPLSIYRKKVFDSVHGFDEKNLTEDIEITWHFIHDGWKVCISLNSLVYTIVPDNFKAWLKQRLRWNMGGIQTLIKYRKTFFRKGMLGFFVLPYFVLAWILGIFGLGLFIYRISRFLILKYLQTIYSVEAQTAVLRLSDLNFSASVLFFFGIVLLVLGVLYNFAALSHSRKESEEFKRENVFNLVTYMFVYLLMYPVVLVSSMYKFVKGD